MAGEDRRVHPDCINASNPYHKCVEYCFFKIAEAKERKDKEQTGMLRSKMAGKDRRVYPDCINASNPYHECVEYCFFKIAEAKERKGKELTGMRRSKMAGEGRRVHPDCINASNPYHECVEYCFFKIAEAKERNDKEQTGVKGKADELSAEDVPISQELPNAQDDTVDGNDQRIEKENDDDSGVDHSKFTGRQKKNEARKANQDIIAEKKRQETVHEPRGVSKQKWIEQKKKILGKHLDANGLDITKAHMLDTQEAAEAKYKKWDKKPAPFGWDVLNQKSLYNAYKKRTKNISNDMDEYAKIKEYAKLTVHAVMLSVEMSQEKYDKLLDKHNRLLNEYNKLKATTSQEALPPSTSTSEFSAQDRETLSLSIKRLREELQIARENEEKAKEEAGKVVTDIIDDILGHRILCILHKLDNVWNVYKNIHEAYKRHSEVQEIFQNVWSKWSTRAEALKEIMATMESDPEAPTNLPQLIKAIGLLGEISAFQSKLDLQFKSKFKMFKDMKSNGMPQILNEAGELKEFAAWKDEFGSIVPSLSAFIYKEGKAEYAQLNNSLDELIKMEINLDIFVKEARTIMDARYSAHNSKVHKLFEVQWPSEDEYNTWLEKFTN